MVVAAVAVSAALSGCSPTPAQESGSGPGGRREMAADPSAGAEKEAQIGASKGTGTTREAFLPILQREHDKIEWPPGFKISADDIWARFMAPAADQNFYSESDAQSMVQIWGICAWTMQLVADVKQQAAVDQDEAALRRLDNGSFKVIIDKMVDGAKLGEISVANQFVAANDCGKGFPR